MLRQFKFRASRTFGALLIGAHATGIAVLPLLALPFWVALILTLALLFSLWYFLRRDAWLALASSCVGLAEEDDGGIVLILRDGGRIPCRILRDSLVMPWLVVLNVLPQGAPVARGVVILPDSMDVEAFRRLRVWLRHGSQPI